MPRILPVTTLVEHLLRLVKSHLLECIRNSFLVQLLLNVFQLRLLRPSLAVHVLGDALRRELCFARDSLFAGEVGLELTERIVGWGRGEEFAEIAAVWHISFCLCG